MIYSYYVIGVDVIEIIYIVAAGVNVYDVVFFGLIRVIFEMLDLMELLVVLLPAVVVLLVVCCIVCFVGVILCNGGPAGVVGVCGLSW